MALKEGDEVSFQEDLGVTTANRPIEACDVVQKRFPKAVADGVFSQGDPPAVPFNWNAHQTEIDLASSFKRYEAMVLEFAGQYLELSGMEKP